MIDPTDIASLLVSMIAAGGAWAAHRSSAKATVISTRTTVEEQAYVRARKFDQDTIDRQEEELTDARAEITLLHTDKRIKDAKIEDLERAKRFHDDEVLMLRNRIDRLETGIPVNPEESIYERFKPDHPER